MVRIKFRYIAIKYSFDSTTKYTINQQTFADIINNLVKVEFGEFGISKITHFMIIDTYPSNSIILFRVGRSSCKMVTGVLTKVKVLSGKMCEFRVVGVSGAIRNAKKKIISELKKN